MERFISACVLSGILTFFLHSEYGANFVHEHICTLGSVVRWSTHKALAFNYYTLWGGLFAFLAFPEQILSNIAKAGVYLADFCVSLFDTYLTDKKLYNKVKTTIKIMIFSSILKFWNKKEKPIYGDSHFMTPREQRKIFHKKFKGWTIGEKRLPRIVWDVTQKNLVVVAPMGGGKSSKIVIPSIFNFLIDGDTNILVNDPSTELYAKTSLEAHRRGFIVKRLSTKNPELSVRINPLTWCKSVSDIQKLAKTLILMQEGSSTSSNAKYFLESAENVLTSILVATWKMPSNVRHLPSAYELLMDFMSDKEDIGKLIERLIGVENRTVLKEWKSFMSSEEKVKDQHCNTAKTALRFAGNETMAQILSGNDFDLSDLREKKIIFYNQYDENDEVYKAINSILLTFTFDTLMKMPKKDKPYRPVMLLLDECYTLDYITGFTKWLANCRKYSCGNLLALQGLGQLQQLYKNEYTALMDALPNKLFFGGLNTTYYKDFQQALGYKTQKDEKDNERKVELMSVKELEQQKNGHAILKIGGEEPIQVVAKGYYQVRRMSKMEGELLQEPRENIEVEYLDLSTSLDTEEEDTIPTA